MEGYSDYERTSWDERKPPLRLYGEVEVERHTILEHFNEYYYSVVQLYNRYKRFGLPFSGGWAEQPEHIVQALDAVEHAIELKRAFEQRKKNDSGRAGNYHRR